VLRSHFSNQSVTLITKTIWSILSSILFSIYSILFSICLILFSICYLLSFMLFYILRSIFYCTFIKSYLFTDLSLSSLIWLSKLDNWFCISWFSPWVLVEIYGGLMGKIIFGELFSTWDKNNNTPLFSLYHKFWITKNISFNQKLVQL